MVIIEDRDIDNEEKTLGIKFDKSRRNALKQMNNIDIIACAGSGKTTLMCAKIDILTKKQPFENKKGIAVLSLTNVAIEQIREKLGRNHKIFEYPNYCETIQKFVSRFVLNNWFNSKYKNKIEIIDNDLFIEQFKSKIDWGKRNYLEKVNFKFEEVYTDGENVYYNDKKIEEKHIGKLKEKNIEYVNMIKKVKLELNSNGVFNFRDAFAIATKYLKENVTLKNYIKERFEIIFVDEMQDCRKWEKDFLDECFSQVTFQKIGDPNQQIYEDTYWKPSNYLNISESLRNSSNIAKFAMNFQDNKSGMTGKNQKDIKVKFLVYTPSTILDIKDKFISEIKKEGLDKRNNGIFKMIGKVSKKNENGKIELVDFCNDMESLENVTSYDYIFYKVLKQNRNKLLKTIIDLMFYYYKRIDKNNYSKINSKNEFIDKIMLYINVDDIYIKLKNSNIILSEFCKEYIRTTLVNIICNKEYFNRIYEKTINEANKEYSKLYEYSKDGTRIEIDTIAGVKGETHTATLVCETYYKNYDIEYVLDNYIRKEKNNKTIKDYLHSLYVAFTRPTDMLCVAIREEVYDNYKQEIDDFDVEIINV